MVDEKVPSGPLKTVLSRRTFVNDPHVEKFVLDEIVALVEKVLMSQKNTSNHANRQY
jgi:hypothetical protein